MGKLDPSEAICAVFLFTAGTACISAALEGSWGVVAGMLVAMLVAWGGVAIANS